MLSDPALLGRLLFVALVVALGYREVRRAQGRSALWPLPTLVLGLMFVGLSIGHVSVIIQLAQR